MKRFVFALALGFVLSFVSLTDSRNGGKPGWSGFELAFTEADARGGRGGGGARRGGGNRGGGAKHGGRPSRSAHSSVRRPQSRPQSRPKRPQSRPDNRPSKPPTGSRPPRSNPPSKGNRDVNVNVDRNVNVDVDDRRNGGRYVAGALVAGAFISSLPSGCNTVVINGISYYDCNNVYYVESFQGTEVVYESVPAPN
jgi:hypothetical protein